MKQISMLTRRVAELEARTAGPNINELDETVQRWPARRRIGLLVRPVFFTPNEPIDTQRGFCSGRSTLIGER
jgi:hypothetical protein